MPMRNDKRDTAKAEYIKRRRSGEKVNLKDLAEKLGVTYGTVRNWKRIDQWDDAVERKRGGQPGNKNSRGKRNAKGNPGGGAPNGNTNAVKDGAVQKMVMDNKDSAFVRVTQLREAMNKVSGRIISLPTQIRQQEEFEKRYALELERLDIAKMRATGEVDVDPEGGTEDETVHD